MQAPKQNIKMNISDILWFDLVFWSHKENAEKKNNIIKSKEHNKDKNGNNKTKPNQEEEEEEEKQNTESTKKNMSDTFAMNKVYEDDTWPWGDQRDNTKKPCTCVLGLLAFNPS